MAVIISPHHSFFPLRVLIVAIRRFNSLSTRSAGLSIFSNLSQASAKSGEGVLGSLLKASSGSRAISVEPHNLQKSMLSLSYPELSPPCRPFPLWVRLLPWLAFSQGLVCRMCSYRVSLVGLRYRPPATTHGTKRLFPGQGVHYSISSVGKIRFPPPHP